MAAFGTRIVSGPSALTQANADLSADEQARVVERESANGAMEYRERLEFALEATGTGTWTFDKAAGTLDLDRRMAAFCGLDHGAIPLRDFAAVLLPADADAFSSLIETPAERDLPAHDLEVRVLGSVAGHERWLAVRGKRAEKGPEFDIIGTARDVTDIRQHGAQVHVLMREVTHRSKNLLAIIQAMARQTVKDSLTAADFDRRFSSRLRGWSFSHELLASRDWRGAALGDLVRGHLQSVLEQHGDRLALSGSHVFIRPEAAQNIGLALNELTSNALQFGALSGSSGKVSLDWWVDTEGAGPRWLHIVWNEYGERAIQPPSRQGFGHKVMERVVARALDGTATMTFAPTGLRWALRIPVSHFVPQDEDQASS